MGGLRRRFCGLFCSRFAVNYEVLVGNLRTTTRSSGGGTVVFRRRTRRDGSRLWRRWVGTALAWSSTCRVLHKPVSQSVLPPLQVQCNAETTQRL